MKAGDTFIPAPPYRHLYAVISRPELDPENVVLVCFTTNTPGEEQCCVATKGDHSYFVHPSAVRYKDARTTSVAKLEQLQTMGQMTPHQPLSPDLLRRVQAGAAISDFLPEGCRRILDEQWLI